MTTDSARLRKPWLYVGTVIHQRLRPVAHGFRYPVFFLRFPLSRAGELANRVFSINRFNLLSFHHADHGDGGDPQAWARALLAREGVVAADGEIELQTFPRVLGYVFNPVSFWFCHARNGALKAVIVEVNNTFGERHCYLLEEGGDSLGAGRTLTARKVFHVSPFCEVVGGYRFRFHAAPRGDTRQVVARIDYHDDGGDLLLTALSGRAREFRAALLLRACLAMPLMTLAVTLRIHWHALLLWLRRVPVVAKPPAPDRLVTR
jgi:hypothetical protein